MVLFEFVQHNNKKTYITRLVDAVKTLYIWRDKNNIRLSWL